MIIFSAKLDKNIALSLTFVFVLFPPVTYAACGTIPATYPLFSGKELKLDEDIVVNGNSVNEDDYKPNAGISPSGNVSTNISLTLPGLDPSSFPSNSLIEGSETISSSSSINHTSEVFYDKIEIEGENNIVNFTGGGAFHIKELIVKEENITLNFAAGIYYINKFIIEGEDFTLNVTRTPVIIHVGDEFKIDGEDAKINTPGNVDDFLVYLHSNAKFESKNEDLDFTGLIYGPNVDKVTIEGEDSSIHGAIIVAGGEIELKEEDISFTYTAADQTAISNIFLGSGFCTISMTAKAIWHMDEPSWNGSSNEVKDSSGNNHSGTPTGASTGQATPAIIGNPGTCSYGKFNGINQKVTVPYSTTLNPDSFTVSFWAKVEGSSGTWRSPITSRFPVAGATSGFNVYASKTNRWEFWTGKKNGWDILKGAPVVNNSWTHIAVSFIKYRTINGIHKGTKKIFINGLLSAKKWGQRYRPNSTEPLFIGAGSYETYDLFNGSIDEMLLFDSALSQSQIQTIMAETHPCLNGGGGDTAATNFNCVENGADGITGKLFTKTTAQSFSFDIVALKDASTIETSFASGADHTVTVELVNAETAASCSSYPALSPAVSQNLTITSANSGTRASASMPSSTAYSRAYSRAYSKVKCRVTDATDNPSVIGCSTDSFAIRPTTFNISSNLTNTGSTGLPKAKAGENFALTATATAGYDGTPSINNSNLQAHVGAIQTGTISGAFSAADSTAGIATGTTFSYSEAGSMRFAAQGVYDDSFTIVDQAGDCTNNFSNTPDANGKVGCMFGNTLTSNYFGRFTPDHFKITAFTNGLFSDTCTSFTYIGQTFSYQTAPTLTVTAYSGLSAPSVTENYTGTYANGLSATDFNVTVPITDSTQTGADGSTLVNLESWIPGTASLADNGNGSLTFTFGSDNYRSRHESNSIIAPFTASVDLEFTDITDNDNIQTPELPHTIQASGASMRFGRLNIDNVHGSELMPLPVPLYTEYYNGTSFITHTDDVCTAIAISDLSFNGGINPIAVGTSTSTASIANSPLNAGVAGLSLSTPSKSGYIDITTGAFISSYSWLGYDWDGDGAYDDAPSARATFGIYKGNSQQIYFREVY